MIVFDIEVYVNYTLFAFRDPNKTLCIEQRGSNLLDKEQLLTLSKIISTKELLTFNGANYDIPITKYLLKYPDSNASKIKEISNDIIDNSLNWFQFYNKYNIEPPWDIKNYDLARMINSREGLKKYGANIHTNFLQDLPYPHDKVLTPAEMEEVKKYCLNDLQLTQDLSEKLETQINIRKEISSKYNINVRADGDAKIAEKIIKQKLEIKKKPDIKPVKDYIDCPEIPSFIKFEKYPEFIEALKLMKFEVDGKVKNPEVFKNHPFDFYGVTLAFGVGGLHSVNSPSCHLSGLIFDVDVVSYYPNIMLNNRIYPDLIGSKFLIEFREIVRQRIQAKKAGDKKTSDILKIVINGTYGKLSDPFSIFYCPAKQLQICLIGQLCLMMLIEKVSLAGGQVIMANTDGITITCEDYESVKQALQDWERVTGFELEEVVYKKLFIQSVNDYIAIKENGVKAIGNLTQEPSLTKTPPTIDVIAVLQKLMNDTPVEETIRSCRDITKFLLVTKSKSGSYYRNKEVGKNIRFYHSTVNENIYVGDNKSLVAKGSSSRPFMDLTDPFPDDLDYDRYIRSAEEQVSKFYETQSSTEVDIIDFDILKHLTPTRIKRYVNSLKKRRYIEDLIDSMKKC